MESQSQRSTLLTRLEKELEDLEGRIEASEDKTTRLKADQKTLVKIIGELKHSLKKSNGSSVAEMRKPAHATA